MTVRRFAQDAVELFVPVFVDVVDMSPHLGHGEERLVHAWIVKYLKLCSNTEISTICSAINKVISRAHLQVK